MNFPFSKCSFVASLCFDRPTDRPTNAVFVVRLVVSLLSWWLTRKGHLRKIAHILCGDFATTGNRNIVYLLVIACLIFVMHCELGWRADIDDAAQ